MISVSRRTFKDLTDSVLNWTGDSGNTSKMRDLVQDAIRESHETRLTKGRFTFMLVPGEQEFTTVAGKRIYSLHEAFLSPLYFWNHTHSDAVRPVTAERLNEFRATGRGRMNFVSLQGMSRVQNQPLTAGTVTATSSSPSDNTKQVLVIGETATGIQEETLTLPNAGSVAFTQIIDVVKISATWVGTLTLTAADGTVVLQLGASQSGRQFRQLYALNDQVGGETIRYQFFRQPKPLRYDNDIPDMPYPFDQLLKLDALVKLAGFTRASAAEVKEWKQAIQELEDDLDGQYSDTQAADSEPAYQVLIPR